LNPDDEIVLHCKAGVRSMKALKALEEMGFSNLKSMRGGINEWSEKIDSSVPLY
jgi:adenylyltransferase/sulfurtransferase